MFRMSSPWDGWAWMRPDDHDAYPFAVPAQRPQDFTPFETFGIDHPDAYMYPTYRASRRPQMTPAAFVSGYPRPPRRQNHNLGNPAPHDPYESFDEPPYNYQYPCRREAPEPAFYFAPGRHPFRVLHPAARSTAVTHEDSGADDFAEEYKNVLPVFLPVAPRSDPMRLKSTSPSSSQRLRQQKQQQRQGQAKAAPSVTSGGAGKVDAVDVAAMNDTDEDADFNDHNNDHDQSSDDTGGASCRATAPHSLLFWDPVTGRCFRGALPTAPAAGGSAVKDRRSAQLSGEATAKPAAKQPPKPHVDAPSLGRAVAVPPSTAAATASPSRSSAASLTAATSTPHTGTTGNGPTRIQVREADGTGASAAKIPVITIPSSGSEGGGFNASADTGPNRGGILPLERQSSTALVTRPPLEVALSRAPSVLPAVPESMPSAAAAAAAVATTASASDSTAATAVAAAAKSAATAAAAATPGGSGLKSSPTPLAVRGKGPFAAAAGPAPRMTRSQAARTIQRWWRGWRLWRHSATLKQLMVLAAELRDAAARFYGYMGATDGNITGRQQVEINELAMRAILKLDSFEGLTPELRALRKHLTSRALRLQDEVHSAYSKSATRPLAPAVGVALEATPAASNSFSETDAGVGVGVGDTSADTESSEQPTAEPTATAAATAVVAGIVAAEPSLSAIISERGTESSTDSASAPAVDVSDAPMTSTSVPAGGSDESTAKPVCTSSSPAVMVAVKGNDSHITERAACCLPAGNGVSGKRCSRKRSSRGGGDDDNDAGADGSRRRSSARGPKPVEDKLISGRLNWRLLRRRLGDVAAAAAKAKSFQPAAEVSSFRLRKQRTMADKPARQQHRHLFERRKRQQQQQQPHVVLRVVIHGDGKSDEGCEGIIHSSSSSGQKYHRTAVLVDSAVQTE